MNILSEVEKFDQQQAAKILEQYFNGFALKKKDLRLHFDRVIYKPFYRLKLSLKKRTIFGECQRFESYLVVDAVSGKVAEKYQAGGWEMETKEVEEERLIGITIDEETALNKAKHEAVRIKIKKKVLTELDENLELYYKPIGLIGVTEGTEGESTEGRKVVFDYFSGRFLTA